MFSWPSPSVISCEKRLENAAFARTGKLWKNVPENKLNTKVFVEQNNNQPLAIIINRRQFKNSWPSLVVILCENAWKMQRSRVRENYRKAFWKTS